MWGPAQSWQTQNLDYGNRYLPCLPVPDVTLVLEGGGQGPGSLYAVNTELGGTKNMGEGARLNVPIITYAYDSTFLNYFGAKGVEAVDSAFAVLNGLPKASSASAKLTEFVTQGNQQVNYSAEAMKMLDLKSTVLWLMMEHMGLIGETHTYDLQIGVAEAGSTGPCDLDYIVLQRNFDPISYSPSSYVNGTFLTYQIGCDPTVPVTDAMEQSVKVGAPPFSAVATREALQLGGYYLRITRDDMGGLRYLYRHNRYINEGLDANITVNTNASFGGASPYTSISLTTTNITSNAVGGAFSGLFGGVEKITFVKTPYDSTLGTAFTPITYNYTIPWATNGTLQSLQVTRTVTAPDIIFAAGNSGDLTDPGPFPYQRTLDRTSGFLTYGFAVSAGTGDPLATPRVITPEMVVTLNDSGQVYYNEAFSFNDQNNAVSVGFIWGSFNGSTNAPIPFPTGSSIEEIEDQVLNAGPEVEIGLYNPVGSSTSTNATASATGVASPQ